MRGVKALIICLITAFFILLSMAISYSLWNRSTLTTTLSDPSDRYPPGGLPIMPNSKESARLCLKSHMEKEQRLPDRRDVSSFYIYSPLKDIDLNITSKLGDELDEEPLVPYNRTLDNIQSMRYDPYSEEAQVYQMDISKVEQIPYLICSHVLHSLSKLCCMINIKEGESDEDKEVKTKICDFIGRMERIKCFCWKEREDCCSIKAAVDLEKCKVLEGDEECCKEKAKKIYSSCARP